MTQVLVVGDANVDLVLRGDVVPRFGQAEQLLDGADLVLGGSGSIVAAGLARLGVDTAIVASVGDDAFGEFQREALSASGVRAGQLIVHPTASTGISIILSGPDDRAILTQLGAIPLLTAAEVRAAVEAENPEHVHFASYFLLSALAADLPSLLGWLRRRGVTTSLDTNWDPAERWAGLVDVLPLVDILLPNLHELRAIAGALGVAHETDEEAAWGLARSGGSRVVVKAGAEGGWSIAGDGAVDRAAGLSVDVVDTTGAGDSFDAGYLAARMSGIGNEATRLRWAATAGSLSTRKSGGTAAQPTRSELGEHL
jgi:ribokinase